MKTIFRNFLTTLKRFKLASSLNILGLSVAFAAFTVIMIQVHYDRSFDQFHPKADRIYRVEVSEDGTQYNALVGRNWAEMFKSRFPQIELTGLRMDFSPIGNYLKVEQNGSMVGFREDVSLIHPDFAEVFDFELVEGTKAAFSEPGRVMIPESTAKRFFGNSSAIDKPITFHSSTDTILTVSGVYKDFPKNTLVKNNVYYAVHPDKWGSYDGWQFNYTLYVTLPESVNKDDLEQEMLATTQGMPDIPQFIKEYKAVRLNPVSDIYFGQDMVFDPDPKGSKATTNVLLAIALLVIAIAAINFVNFSTSLTPMRIKSINTQKVLGSPTSTLRWGMIIEAVGIVVLAFGLSLLWVYVLGNTGFNHYIVASINIGTNLPVVLLSLGVALAVGLIAGVYPAYYSTSFPPALVLKGSFGLSPKGRKLRTALIGFQFVVSIGLIIAALFMQLQNGFLLKVDPGYTTDQVVVMELNQDFFNQRDLLENKLKESPQIVELAFSQFLFGTGDAQANTVEIDSEPMRYAYFPVSENFLKVMDIPLMEGGEFRKEDMANCQMIVNQAAYQAWGVELGHSFPWHEKLTGIVDNINFRSLHHTSEEPFAFVFENSYGDRRARMPWTYVKTTGNVLTAVDHIKKSIASIDPTFPVDIRFYDTIFNDLYQKDRKTTGLITIFSLLAVIISLVGVFGLVVFETQYRRKEIGIRKVMGATVMEILGMFNRQFLWIVGICFVVAAPLAWYGIAEWLATFAYRTPMYWWVFGVALVIVSVITLTTVTIQSWRAATVNPVHSLRAD